MKGAQSPRVALVPEFSSSTGDEAIDLCRLAGLYLDSWQEYVLRNALGERPDGGWAAFEVGLVVPRQNGKGAILEARELAGLFLLEDERLIVHTAHEAPTAMEAFRRLADLIEGCPDLSKRVKSVSRAHGNEAIELKNGKRIRFRTRTKGGGRGWSADCVILDEAMYLPTAAMSALLYTLSARPNPQVWYTGSAVDQQSDDTGRTLAGLRERGLAGEDGSLAYFEWSLDADDPDDVPNADDPEAWAQANPGMGLRIATEHVEKEYVAADPRSFAVERLGVGDWPSGDGTHSVITREDWEATLDPASRRDGAIVFTLDVAPDQASAAIGVAGWREDGLKHIEVAKHERGTGWVTEWLAERLERIPTLTGVLLDEKGPAGALLPELRERGIDVEVVTASEHAQACGMFVTAVRERTFRHIGQAPLDAAIKGAAKRPLGDAWAWSRKSSSVDISPLVAATLAHWGLVGNSGAGGFEWE